MGTSRIAHFKALFIDGEMMDWTVDKNPSNTFMISMKFEFEGRHYTIHDMDSLNSFAKQQRSYGRSVHIHEWGQLIEFNQDGKKIG